MNQISHSRYAMSGVDRKQRCGRHGTWPTQRMPQPMPTHAHPCPPMHGMRCTRPRMPPDCAWHRSTGWLACGLLQDPSQRVELLGTPAGPRGQEAWCAAARCQPASPCGSRIAPTQRGTHGAARILSAGLFLASRRLVRNSPSSPRRRCVRSDPAPLSRRACARRALSPLLGSRARLTCIAATLPLRPH